MSRLGTSYQFFTGSSGSGPSYLLCTSRLKQDYYDAQISDFRENQ